MVYPVKVLSQWHTRLSFSLDGTGFIWQPDVGGMDDGAWIDRSPFDSLTWMFVSDLAGKEADASDTRNTRVYEQGVICWYETATQL